MEPISIDGLGCMTAAQQALTEFLEVDTDLIAGAGVGREASQRGDISEKEMDKWIYTLPRDEVNQILKQLLEGKGQQAERSIKNKYAKWLRSVQTDRACIPRRTAGELRENADKIRQTRLDKQKHDREQREIKRQKDREAYLKALSNNFSRAWESVRKPIELGTGRGYGEACRALVDIAEAYALFSTKEQFQKELKKFMADYIRRKALIQRLVKAGIWMDQ